MELSSLACGQLPPSWQPGSHPHSLHICQQLPAERWKGMKTKVCPKWGEKNTKAERGGSRCCPCAFAGSSQACCVEPSQHMLHCCSQAAQGEMSSPSHTLHFGLPRSWSLVSSRYQQARLVKYISPSGKEGLSVAYWSQKFWITESCIAGELILSSDKWLFKSCTLLPISPMNISDLCGWDSGFHRYREAGVVFNTANRCILQLAGSWSFLSCLCNKQESLPVPASGQGNYERSFKHC